MKNLGQMPANLILMLAIWNVLRIQFSVFLISFHLLKENIFIRVKESPFMTKELHKAIVKRYKLRNKFFKSKWFSDRKTYTSRHNFCKKLLRNTKRTYFDSLNI